MNENLRTIQTSANEQYLYLNFNQLMITIKSFTLIEYNTLAVEVSAKIIKCNLQ